MMIGRTSSARVGRRSDCSRSAHAVGRGGYVLIVTLGLLVLSTTLLVAVGRMATQHALAARLAADEAQRRWGAESCRACLLPAAERILLTATARSGKAMPVVRRTMMLGNQQFTLIVSDEMAKANVNTLLEETDAAAVENRLRQSLAGSGLGNAIRLRPTPADLNLFGPPTTRPAAQPGLAASPTITSLGQIFDNVPPERLIAGPSEAPIDRLTCWGGGGINVMRASEAALRLAVTPRLTNVEISRLLEARDRELNPQARKLLLPRDGAANATNLEALDDASRLLAKARIQVRDRARLPLVGKSSCHSLWIIIHEPGRSWFELTVHDESDAQRPRTDAYVW